MCHARVCDVRVWSHKAEARFKYLYGDEIGGDISLLCPKCKQQIWMSII